MMLMIFVFMVTRRRPITDPGRQSYPFYCRPISAEPVDLYPAVDNIELPTASSSSSSSSLLSPLLPYNDYHRLHHNDNITIIIFAITSPALHFHDPCLVFSFSKCVVFFSKKSSFFLTYCLFSCFPSLQRPCSFPL